MGWIFFGIAVWVIFGLVILFGKSTQPGVVTYSFGERALIFPVGLIICFIETIRKLCK